MADFSGNPWHFYPGDVPGKLDFDSPGGGPIFVKKFVWRKSNDAPDILPGHVCHVRDRRSNDPFKRVWPTDYNDATLESEHMGDQPFYGMYVEALDSGVLDVYVE